MSLPFERNIVQDNIHQLTDPRNQNGRWECSQCKHEYHVPPIQVCITVYVITTTTTTKYFYFSQYVLFVMEVLFGQWMLFNDMVC